MEKKQHKNYRLQITGSVTFMTSSSSTVVNNLAEGIQKIKCKYRHDNKKSKIAELDTNIVSTFLSTQTLKMI